MKKLIAIALTIMVAFSFIPGLTGNAYAAAKKPAKVKFAKCVSGKYSVALKWKKAKKAKKYEVYQLKAKKYKKIKTVKKTKFTVKKLKANTVYRFKVRGVNGKKKGKFSAVKKIRTKKVVKKKKINTDTDTNTSTNSDSNNNSGDDSDNNNNSSTSSDNTNNSTNNNSTNNNNTNTNSVQQIAFANSTVSMTVDSSETLTLSNPSMAEATYTSSNTSVVGVERFSKSWVVINAKSAGKATITAKAGNKTATCVITINNNNSGESNTNNDDTSNPANDIAFTYNTLTTSVDSNETLYLTNPSYTDVTYISSNPSVVSVERVASTWVVVSAKKVGKAIITAKAGNITATCIVTVTSDSNTGNAGTGDDGNSLKSISFDKTELEVNKGNEATLILSFNPSSAAKTPTFKTSDSSVAEIKSQTTTSVTIVGKNPGEATISATCDGKTTSCNIEVKGLKYSYEIYKLKGQQFVTGLIFNYVLIKTTNPNPETFWLQGDFDVTSPSTTKLFSYSKDIFSDLKMMLDKDSLDNYYYFSRICENTGAGLNHYTIKEQLDYYSNVNTSKTFLTINYVNYDRWLSDWINKEISQNTNSSMSLHEKMYAVCNSLRGSATYNFPTAYNKYSIYTSMYLASTTPDVSRCWDSAFKAPLFEIARQLDYPIKNYDEAGKDNSYHACVYGYDGGVEHQYHICPTADPNYTNAPDISNCRQLTLDDYELITRIEQ